GGHFKPHQSLDRFDAPGSLGVNDDDLAPRGVLAASDDFAGDRAGAWIGRLPVENLCGDVGRFLDEAPPPAMRVAELAFDNAWHRLVSNVTRDGHSYADHPLSHLALNGKFNCVTFNAAVSVPDLRLACFCF